MPLMVALKVPAPLPFRLTEPVLRMPVEVALVPGKTIPLLVIAAANAPVPPTVAPAATVIVPVPVLLPLNRTVPAVTEVAPV